MVQNEVEAQSAQLFDHCQYGLEQVEAEKLHLIAGQGIFLFIENFLNISFLYDRLFKV